MVAVPLIYVKKFLFYHFGIVHNYYIHIFCYSLSDLLYFIVYRGKLVSGWLEKSWRYFGAIVFWLRLVLKI